MKNMLQKSFSTVLFMAVFGMFTSTIQAMSKDEQSMSDDGVEKPTKNSIFIERRTANVIDATIVTVVAKVVNDCIIQNPSMSLLSSAGYGVGGWLAGELAETIYKKAYKVITGKNLRETLGETEIFGFKIDNQRLLRRIITITGLCVTLYLQGQ